MKKIYFIYIIKENQKGKDIKKKNNNKSIKWRE